MPNSLKASQSTAQAARLKAAALAALAALWAGWNILLWVQQKGEWFFCDAYNRWQECAYTLRGINPFAIISGAQPVVEELGRIPANCGTVPWAYILGNAFQPGFLPWGAAQAWAAAVMLVLALTAAATLAAWLKRGGYVKTRRAALLTAALILLPAAWASTFYYGNQTGAVLGLIVLGFCCLDAHPLCAGVLLGFAMCKPQMAFVFFWPLLLRGRFKTIFTSVATVLAAWAAAACMTGSSMLAMFTEIFNQGTGFGASPAYMYGIFDGLLAFGQSTRTVLLLDAAAALALFAAAAIWLLHNRCGDDWLAWMGIAAVISIIWFYKQPHDFIVLGLAAVCIFCAPRLPAASIALLLINMDEIIFNQIQNSAAYMGTTYLTVRLARMLLVTALLPCVLYAAGQRKKVKPKGNRYAVR